MFLSGVFQSFSRFAAIAERNWDGSAVVSYAVVSTHLGMFRHSVVRRTVLRHTVLYPFGCVYS